MTKLALSDDQAGTLYEMSQIVARLCVLANDEQFHAKVVEFEDAVANQVTGTPFSESYNKIQGLINAIPPSSPDTNSSGR